MVTTQEDILLTKLELQMKSNEKLKGYIQILQKSIEKDKSLLELVVCELERRGESPCQP